MAIRTITEWWKVLWPGNWWSAAKRIYHGWCWRCGGQKGDQYEHLHGCTPENGGVHLEDQPWTRFRWALLMVPLGVLVLVRLVLCAVLLLVYYPVTFLLALLGVNVR